MGNKVFIYMRFSTEEKMKKFYIKDFLQYRGGLWKNNN